MRERADYLHAPRILAASSALAGRMDEARTAVARLRQLDPEFRVCTLKDRFPIRRPQDLARFAEGLRKAGLPEE
jgi:hypothetical protein